MPKTAQLPLFDDVEATRSIQPKTSTDDETFRKERRRNRKKPGRLAGPPATGPCCFRCAKWRRPFDGDEYGECGHLGVSTERSPAFGIEKGTVVSFDEAKEYGVFVEPLRTGPAFICRAYQAIEEKAA